MRALLSLVAFSLLFVLTSVARADIPPPKDYVEKCTLELQCLGGSSCQAVRGEANAECAKKLNDQGMNERCQTYGATVATAIFCPKDAPLPPAAKEMTPTAPVKSGSCAVAIGGGTGAPLAVLGLFALGLGLSRRRRRA